MTNRFAKRRRLLWLLPSVIAGMVAGLVVWTNYNSAQKANQKVQAEIDAIAKQIEAVNAEATEAEDAILAQMKRGIPIHPSRNCPADEYPFKTRALLAMVDQLADPRPAVALYAAHDLSRMQFTPEDRKLLVPLLRPHLADPQRLHIYVGVLKDVEGNLAEPYAALIEAVDRKTYDNLETIALNMFCLNQPPGPILSLYVDMMRHQVVEHWEGQRMLDQALRIGYFTPDDLQAELQFATRQSTDDNEQERLQFWLGIVDSLPWDSYPRSAIRLE